MNRDVYCICSKTDLKRTQAVVQITLWRRVVCVMNVRQEMYENSHERILQ